MHITLKSMLSLLLLGFVAVACNCVWAGDGQTPITIQTSFADDSGFKDLNINAREWKVTEGELRNMPGAVATFEFGNADWNDYEIDFKAKRLKVDSKDQHFGIFVRKSPEAAVRLYCRGNAIIYMADSRHDVLGKLAQPMTVAPDAPWTAFHIAVKGPQIKVSVDNVLVGTLDNVALASGKISIYAYNLEIALKDLKVIVTKTGENTTKK